MNILKKFFYLISGNPKSGNPLEKLGGTSIIIIMEIVTMILLIHLGMNTNYHIIIVIISVMLIWLIYKIGWTMSMNRFCNHGNNGHKLTKEVMNENTIVSSKNVITFIIGLMISEILLILTLYNKDIYACQLAIAIMWSIGWSVSIYLKNKNQR